MHTFHIYSLLGWIWDRNTNKPEIKTFAFLSINFHNLQIIFFLPLALILANLQFWWPKFVHPYNIKFTVEWSLENNNCIPSLMFFCYTCLWKTVYQHYFVYSICEYTTEHSFTPIIWSNFSYYSMTFYYSRKLPSKVPSVRR